MTMHRPPRVPPCSRWRVRPFGSHDAVLLSVLCLLFLGSTEVARGAVYLNEVVVRGTEQAEIYNSGPDPILLNGWVLRGDLGDFVIPDGELIATGEYLVFDDLGDILHDIGGEVALIDDLKLSRDAVAYGQVGGAPLPHDSGGVSLCRAPDAATDPPIDPANDALFWTLDLTQTFGAANDAPNPNLGSSLVFNELGTTSPSALVVNDSVELFNPTGGPVVTSGWFMTFGAGSTVVLTTSTVPPGTVVVVKLPSEIELDTTQLAYLFDPTGVRVDQVGWSGSFFRGEGSCIGRCPDGQGPNDGYDGNSSGGGDTLVFTNCTLGELNGTCDPTPVEETSWGQIRLLYR